MTIKQLIQSCLPIVGLPRDPIPVDVRDVALDVVNSEGKKIWIAWPWDNTKIDEFTAPAPAAGIITFDTNVDVIRAIRTLTSADETTSAPVFAHDEIQAVIQGATVLSDSFESLADDPDTGGRRIRVEDSADKTYRVLALLRWVDYDSTTYLTESFLIDRAETALRQYIIDGLREWLGDMQGGKGDVHLQLALRRENEHHQREQKVLPRTPLFQEAGRW